ncbi:MAG: hypothetical protein R6V27_06375 [Balneolaceae bacterium]
MNSRFTHICRTAVIALLFTGFAAHLSVPFFSDVQKTAFTQWLNQKVVAADGDYEQVSDLKKRISQLSSEAPNFFLLVQDASRLIADYKDTFDISPFSSGQQQDRDQVVLNWLIGQWNTFKHQQSTANAVVPETVHPLQKSVTQLQPFAGTITVTVKIYLQKSFSGIFTPEFLPGIPLSPPASGISINAP